MKRESIARKLAEAAMSVLYQERDKSTGLGDYEVAQLIRRFRPLLVAVPVPQVAAPAPETPGVRFWVVAWLKERLENCNRIAATKTGKDRFGWLGDAQYFQYAIDLLNLGAPAIAEHPDTAALFEKLLDAARCIRHWHDTGRENEGMIVSSEHVRSLWDAVAAIDAARAGEKK